MKPKKNEVITQTTGKIFKLKCVTFDRQNDGSLSGV